MKPSVEIGKVINDINEVFEISFVFKPTSHTRVVIKFVTYPFSNSLDVVVIGEVSELCFEVFGIRLGKFAFHKTGVPQLLDFF